MGSGMSVGLMYHARKAPAPAGAGRSQAPEVSPRVFWNPKRGCGQGRGGRPGASLSYTVTLRPRTCSSATGVKYVRSVEIFASSRTRPSAWPPPPRR